MTGRSQTYRHGHSSILEHNQCTGQFCFAQSSGELVLDVAPIVLDAAPSRSINNNVGQYCLTVRKGKVGHVHPLLVHSKPFAIWFLKYRSAHMVGGGTGQVCYSQSSGELQPFSTLSQADRQPLTTASILGVSKGEVACTLGGWFTSNHFTIEFGLVLQHSVLR